MFPVYCPDVSGIAVRIRRNMQNALLMFQVLYGHSTNGIIEFFIHLSYLLSQSGVWSWMKKGIKYFGDIEMYYLLERMEEVYNNISKNEERNCDWKNFNTIAEEDQIVINELNQQLSERMSITIKLVAAYIRNHAEEFIQINTR